MKQLILFAALLGLAACQPSADVAPASVTGKVIGAYQTNGFLDYRCLALPANQMATVTLHATGNNTLMLTLAQSFPKASLQTITGVTLAQQPDQLIELIHAGQVIGTIQTSRVFTASGMEAKGKLLRLSIPNVVFMGYQP